MARTPDHQGDSPRTAGGGQRRPPQEQRASEPDAAVVVLTSEGQRRLAVRAAWLATELVPRLAHSQDGWASGEYERAVRELARLTRILGQAMTTHELPPEDPGIVELGDEVVVEFAAGDTERYLVVDPIEAPLDDVRISVESPLAGPDWPPSRRAGGGQRPRRSLPVPHPHHRPVPDGCAVRVQDQPIPAKAYGLSGPDNHHQHPSHGTAALEPAGIDRRTGGPRETPGGRAPRRNGGSPWH
jgi:transcription elongation GreA/GreB family factor